MSPKYTTGDSTNATEWHSDRRHVFATWKTNPFTGVRHRHETVEHRLVVEYTHPGMLDVIHEARSDDAGKISDEWTEVERLEVREYGAQYYRHPEARWLE